MLQDSSQSSFLSTAKSGLSISLSLLADIIAGFISYYFIGKYDYYLQPNLLSGYFWGTALYALFILRSLDQGFAILSSRLFVAKKYQELGALYQKHLFFAAACWTLPILFTFFMGFSGSRNAVFMRSMIPSMISSFLFNSTKHFLIAQNIIITPTIITFGLLPVQALLCYIFVDVLDMPVSSVAFAKSITDVIAVIILFNYIRSTGIFRDTWIPLTKECLKNWRLHFQQTFGFGATIFIEFLVYGSTFFWTSRTLMFKGFYEFEIHDAAFAIAYALFCVPWGISLAMKTKICNIITEGSQKEVKKILAAGIVLNSIFSLIAVVSIVIFRKQIASYFYTDGPSSEIFENMILFYVVSFTFDSYSNIIEGVLMGIGKVAIASSLQGYVLTGQFILGMVFQFGYMAIWICLAVGSFLRFAYSVYALCILDWKEQIQETKRTLGEQASGETQGFVEFTDMT